MPTHPPRRTFAVIGILFTLAAAGIIGAVWWFSPTALALEQTLVLLVAAATVTIPIHLFVDARYSQSADRTSRARENEAHDELHAAHGSILRRTDVLAAANRQMHNMDRREIAALTGQAEDLDTRLKARGKQIHMLEKDWAAAQTQQAAQTARDWADHRTIHAQEADAAKQAQRQTIAQIDALELRIEEAKDLHTALSQKMRAELAYLREAAQDPRAPESQMREWTTRVNEHVDHSFARFRHKIQHQLDQFEARELSDLEASNRQGRKEAALLAEDLLEERIGELDAEQETRLDTFKAWLEEQFAGFLAGQMAQRTENEARLAAIGATRGVRVEGSDAYSVTSHAPFGRVHPIGDIEGIGHKTAYTLQKIGILDTEHLWHADTTELADKLDITARQIRQWQSQAELMALHGVGKQWAELLAVSGVTSITHLANLHARELMELLRTKGAKHDIQRSHIGLGKAEDFIQAAREHHPSEPVYV